MPKAKAKLLNQDEEIKIKLKLKCREDGVAHSVEVEMAVDASRHGLIHALTAILRKIDEGGRHSAEAAAMLALGELDNDK